MMLQDVRHAPADMPGHGVSCFLRLSVPDGLENGDMLMGGAFNMLLPITEAVFQ